MVGRALALALVPLDRGTRDGPRERGGGLDEVDAHALVPREAQLLVVPVGELLRDEPARHLGEAVLRERREGRTFGRGHVGGPGEELHGPHVLVLRGDVPVPHEGDPGLRLGPHPAAGRLPERRQPRQLVLVVGVGDLTPVRDVQAPHAHAAVDDVPPHRRAQRAGLRGVPPGGHALEPGGDVVEPHARGDGDAVPLVVPVVRHLVAQGLERGAGELLVPALGLLHGEHVHPGPLQEGGDPVDAGADRVDVPRGELHAPQPNPRHARGTAYA